MAPNLLTGFPLIGYNDDAVAAACARVRNICGWHIAPVVTETISLGPLRRRWVLPSLRVVTVNSLTVDGVVVGFDWDPHRVSVEPHSLTGRGVAQVNLTHGYDICPDDVRSVVARMAKSGFAADQVVRAQVGDVAATFGVVDTELDAYRLPVVA